MRSLLLALLCCTTAASAQPFAIGNVQRTFTDVARGRAVPCAIRYPAAVAGNNAAVAAGLFPVIVVGHGFVMGVDAYTYFWQHFVPLGYIVALPTTEGDLSPDHAAFGADLAFVATHMTTEGVEPTSIFFGRVGAGRVLAGHSMGGGAALLGAANNADIKAVLVMAPAETDPSAIAAAATISAPTLIFAATEDCVTPLATNQQPMYAAITQPCKALVNISGGGHCYFGNDNFLCGFGELTCGPDLTISREQQHAVVTDLGTLWLDAILRDAPGAWDVLVDSLETGTRYTASYNCMTTGLRTTTDDGNVRLCTTADGVLVESTTPVTVVGVVDAAGRCVLQPAASTSTRIQLDLRGNPAGLYLVQVQHGDGRMSIHRTMR